MTSIEKLRWIFPMGTRRTVIDTEEMTVLELIGTVANKVNEVVEVANVIEQSAYEARTIVDEMVIQQQNFINDNDSVRQEVAKQQADFFDNIYEIITEFETSSNVRINTLQTEINELLTSIETTGNQDLENFKTSLNTQLNTFIISINESKSSFETLMTTELTAFKSDLNKELSTFKENMQNQINSFVLDLTTTKNNFIIEMNRIIAESEQQIVTAVNTKINTMSTDGSLEELINDVLLEGINQKVDKNILIISATEPITSNNWFQILS